MDQAEMLAFIREVETEDASPGGIAHAYARAVYELQPKLTGQELQRLLLIGAAMLKSGIQGEHMELQIPPSAGSAIPDIEDMEPVEGYRQ